MLPARKKTDVDNCFEWEIEGIIYAQKTALANRWKIQTVDRYI